MQTSLEAKKIHSFFKKQKVDPKNCFYVDVGANDGVTGSQTLMLENNGWKGLLIEPNPSLYPLLKKRNAILETCLISDQQGVINYFQVSGIGNLHGLSRIVADERFRNHVRQYGGHIEKLSIATQSLNDLLEKNKVSHDFEFLKIDVEGQELNVLKTINFHKYSPKIIILEDNSKGEDQGPSNYLKSFGYWRVARTGTNDWYTKKFKFKFFPQMLLAHFKFFKWSLRRQWYRLQNKKYQSPWI